MSGYRDGEATWPGGDRLLTRATQSRDVSTSDRCQWTNKLEAGKLPKDIVNRAFGVDAVGFQAEPELVGVVQELVG